MRGARATTPATTAGFNLDVIPAVLVVVGGDPAYHAVVDRHLDQPSESRAAAGGQDHVARPNVHPHSGKAYLVPADASIPTLYRAHTPVELAAAFERGQRDRDALQQLRMRKRGLQ